MERWVIRIGGGILAVATGAEVALVTTGDPFGVGVYGGLLPVLSLAGFGAFVLFAAFRGRLR